MLKPIRKPTLLTCPCCKQVRQAGEHLYFSQFVWDKFFYSQTGDRIENTYWPNIKKGNPNWACDKCLEEGHALKGNPDKQNFCDCYPHFAYFDKPSTCRDRSNEFIFSKYEQRHWYEKLGLLVQAEEVRCNPCRHNKKMRDKLFKLLGNFDYKDMEKTQETIALCLKLGFYQQAQHVLNLVQKKYKKTSAEFMLAGKLLLEAEKAKQVADNAQEAS